MNQVYISGPMTGLPDLNFPAFHAAARVLRDAGFAVVNPAELNPDPQASWQSCMRADIKALCDCQGLVLLPGWERSSGAHLELHVAHRLGLLVHTLEQALGGGAALARFWENARHEQEATAAQAPALAFLPRQATLQDVDKDLAELHAFYRRRLDAATTAASKHAVRGSVERQRRSQAAAQAWRAALQQLAHVASHRAKVAP